MPQMFLGDSDYFYWVDSQIVSCATAIEMKIKAIKVLKVDFNK